MKLARYIILLVLTALLVWGWLWSHEKASDELCQDVIITIKNADSTNFVTARGIRDELRNAHIRMEGAPMWQINTNRIERVLEKSEYLEDIDCYKAQNGRVMISASQMVPVMRVFDGDNSYYVNRYGKRMSATASYHVDVPVVHGHFTTQYPVTRLLPMVTYVEADEVLRNLITMYDFHDSTDIYLVPSILGHVVNMGSVDGYENKFAKLQLFYKRVMPEKGWLTYDTLSLKWDHQVVATRRQKAVQTEFNYDAELDEPVPDMETMTVSSDKPTLAAQDADIVKRDVAHEKAAEAKAKEKEKETKAKESEEKTKKNDKADTEKSKSTSTGKKDSTDKAKTEKKTSSASTEKAKSTSTEKSKSKSTEKEKSAEKKSSSSSSSSKKK